MFDFSLCGLEPEQIEGKARKYAFLLDQAAAGFPSNPESSGWADPDGYVTEALLDRIEKKAAQIQKEGTLFVLIGVGGSNNAARSVIEDLRPSGVKVLDAGTALAPSAISQVLEEMEGQSVFLNIVAKNFATLEPGATFRVLRKWMRERYGSQAASRILATGPRGSLLHRLSEENGWDFFDFPTSVGGRYSAMTEVGLLPMAVAGVDIRKLVKGTAAMRAQLLSAPAPENPALFYAAARNLLYEKGYRAEMLTFFEPRLRWFSKWWILLFSESEGKNELGLLPLSCECSEELHSMGQFLQQGSPMVFETFLRVREASPGPSLSPDDIDDGFGYLDEKRFGDLNAAAEAATISAHAEHLPCLQLSMENWGEEAFGSLFYFFMLSCVFSCAMAGVDPFDQPGVETYKQSMFKILGKR